MGREEGGGFRMGNTCIPVADSFDIWQNQNNIVKLNKIKFLKKNSLICMTSDGFQCLPHLTGNYVALGLCIGEGKGEMI